MATLTWVNNVGVISKDGRTGQVRSKPFVGFDYDSLYVEPTNNVKVVAGVTSQLTSQERDAVLYWISTADMDQYQKLLGVDADGVFLGIVTSAAAAHRIVGSAPPNGDHWLYNLDADRWEYIYGVDADGAYIGNVPFGAYVTRATDAPPPSAGEVWRWDGEEWLDVRTAKDKLHQVNTRTRQSKVTGSADLWDGSKNVPTWIDPDSRGAMLGLVVAAQANPALSTQWKGADGAFYALNAAQIIALFYAGLAFIDQCFTAEATIAAGIDADAITTDEQIIDAYDAVT